MAIVKRLDKGTALTYAELDGNFDHLTGEDAAIRAEFAAADAVVTAAFAAADDIAQAAVEATAQAALDAHTGDTSGAHAASAISYTPTGTVAGATVQAAIDEVVSDLAASSGSSLVGFLQSGTGASARTTQAKLRESISVKDFGAVGDGVTDDLAAFQAAHDSLSGTGVWKGGEIIIPPGSYYLSDTWVITKRINIRGTNRGEQETNAATLLTFAEDVTGIRVHSSMSTPVGGSGDRTHISDINLFASSTGTTGHGIHSSCHITIERVSVRDFAENGINIVANSGTGTGIANNWTVKDCRIVTNGGHGMFISEADANAGVAINVDCTENGGWGFYEDSKLGNTYIACHAAGNTSGSYKTTSTVGHSVFVGCYAEGGTGAAASFAGPSMAIGGILGAGADGFVCISGLDGATTSDMRLNVPTGGRYQFRRNGIEIARIDTTNIFSGLAGYWCTTGTNKTTKIEGPQIEMVTDTNSAQDRMRFDTPSGRAGSVTTTNATTAYNTSSDYRMKENVVPIENALSVVENLNPVSFKWKNCDGGSIGFIAHELQEFSPECVTGKKDEVDENGIPIYQAVDLSFLIPTLTKAIQELKSQVEELTKRLAE